MLPHKKALVLPKECGIAAPCFHLLPCGHFITWSERGEVLPVFGGTSGDQLWEDRPDVKGCFWEARWGGEDPVPSKALLSLSLFLPLLYKSKSQYQRRLLSGEVHCTDSLMILREWLPNTSVECEGEQHGEEQYIPEDNWSWDSSTETLQRMVQAADNLFQVQDYFERSKQIVK